MRRTIRCTGSRKVGSSTAITPATATCRFPIFCGRHLLAAKLRRSNIDGAAGTVEQVARFVAQTRRRWPRVGILLRGDSGFAREALMAWCEANRVDFLFGLARNERLEEAIRAELMTATLDSIPDRPVGALLQGLHLVEAGQLEPQPSCRWQGRGDPRAMPIRGFVVTSLKPAEVGAGISTRRSTARAADGEPHQGIPARPVR